MAANPDQRVPWKQDAELALIWGVLAALSAVALIPYLRQTMPGVLDTLRIPLPAFVARGCRHSYCSAC